MSGRLKRLARWLAVGLVSGIAVVLALIGVLLFAIQTPWGKRQIRDLIVSQANDYLTAKLEIGELGGSLLRGVELSGVSLAQDGRTIVSIDAVNVSYSIRELLQPGLVIRSIRLTRPQVTAERQEDGRWNLATLVRRQSRERDRSGPARPLEIQSIEVQDGLVVLEDPLAFGAARVPGRFDRLNASLTFTYAPVEWAIDFERLSWASEPSGLIVERLEGRMANGRDGWSFDTLRVQTPRSLFTLHGRILRGGRPAVLDLDVDAERFAFQEWSGILTGLRNIAVESSFAARLNGSLTNLATEIDLRSDGGDAKGRLTLDTSVPGWLGAGAMNLTALNLARWFNRPDRASDITGHVTFDLALRLGAGIPRGHYAFDGPKAAYLGYEGERIRVRGDITADEWRIAGGTAVAYGADVVMDAGGIGLTTPYPFRFQGVATGVDLRLLPERVPVPHVESRLAFEFDARGQFVSPFLSGRAWFDDSEFIGAGMGRGTTGTLDTSAVPVAYSGEGNLAGLDIARFGQALDIGWMQDPRYAGTVSGRFRVEGAGGVRETMWLKGGGRLTSADAFGGSLRDADVDVDIRDGSLRGSYNGRFVNIDPAIPFDDARVSARLTGTGTVRFTVPELLLRSPQLGDYDIDGSLTFEDARAQGIQISPASVKGQLTAGTLSMEEVTVKTPELEARGSGAVDFSGKQSSSFQYDIQRADLTLLKDRLGPSVRGQAQTSGAITGLFPHLQVDGRITATQAEYQALAVGNFGADYHVSVPLDRSRPMTARLMLEALFVNVFRTTLQQATATVELLEERIAFDGELVPEEWPAVMLEGAVGLRPEGRSLDLLSLSGSVGPTHWTLSPATPPPVVTWDAGAIAVTHAVFTETGNVRQQIEIAGDWRQDGGGALHVVASNFVLDNLAADSGTPAPYGGTLNVDATLRGTRERPLVTGQLLVSQGRVYRLSFEKLSGDVGYEDGALQVDVRLDQSPGVWLIATGMVPPTLFSRNAPEAPVSLAIRSSRVGLGLLEGLTTAVRDVTGDLYANIDIVGTTRDPHFQGTLELGSAAFVVSASGARYRNGNIRLDLSQDRVTVTAFHLEDREGDALTIKGSLGTHELRVGDFAIDASARAFDVLNNEFGNVEVHTGDLSVRGTLEAPRLSGNLTVEGEVRVDEILSRALLQPYSTEAMPPPTLDAIAALNFWDRLSMTILLHSLGGLRLVGDSVTLSAKAPIGLGSFDINAAGDIVIYKEPEQPVSVTGSYDSLAGRFVFQGRRFELYPSSSVDFRGDFRNPELFITVYRDVSGVETRVTISGPLREPELRLSSNPPLDPSDVLSLIVFNTTTNELSAAQQQELTVRAGALAVGFLANALTAALERSLGIDILEIEPSTGPQGGAKVTVGEEIAPGLVARFSRYFGADEYDEATIEYYISRLLRLRATFSDASSVSLRRPFRRVETVGVDLLVFFSF